MPGLPLPLFHLFPAQAEVVVERRGGHSPGYTPRAFEADYALAAKRAIERARRTRADDELLALL